MWVRERADAAPVAIIPFRQEEIKAVPRRLRVAMEGVIASAYIGDW